jgi:2-polyprenyl-3-methyl-5-hydroxy-6-metoxy-1,4-benzoquinol methylase
MENYKTAMGRKTISTPMRYLDTMGVFDTVDDRVLDYGCGKGFDADALALERYDPHFFPVMPKGKFDLITCNYVLNVVLPESIPLVLDKIMSKLKAKGVAYISVRRDIPKEGKQGKGCYQYYVSLPFPVVKENSTFCIYKLDKTNFKMV